MGNIKTSSQKIDGELKIISRKMGIPYDSLKRMAVQYYLKNVLQLNKEKIEGEQNGAIVSTRV